uniref:Uncharacterized protein n=1 Tax=Glossina austeni TaxID=7395 RepID=A0A1A9UG53_GLOAU
MDNKKDIYNLWVQYTTKNEESYFREFIERFVNIWRSQLPLDFSTVECPYWYEVKPDNGPHLGRLPDELLPAIGKFIIVASDQCANEKISNDTIHQISVLIDCLVVICRHFDNILAVIKYEYKSNLIAILTHVFQQTLKKKSVSNEVSRLFRSFSQFLEVMYDPYLTWRSFLRNNFADYKKLPYKPHNVHVEIIPFIYGKYKFAVFLKKIKFRFQRTVQSEWLGFVHSAAYYNIFYGSHLNRTTTKKFVHMMHSLGTAYCTSNSVFYLCRLFPT